MAFQPQNVQGDQSHILLELLRIRPDDPVDPVEKGRVETIQLFGDFRGENARGLGLCGAEDLTPIRPGPQRDFTDIGDVLRFVAVSERGDLVGQNVQGIFCRSPR